MSRSSEYRDYHLTPNGWVEGSTKKDFVGYQQLPTPSDRVLTVRYMEKIPHSSFECDSSSTQIWQIENEQLIDELLAKYGPSPKGI